MYWWLLRWLLPSPYPRSSTQGWQRTRPASPVRQARKPLRVVDELIRLKALMPQAGCRLVADCFNRRFAAKRQVSVSKSYVVYTLRQRQ